MPDLAEELRMLAELRSRARSTIRARLHREAELIGTLPQRLRTTIHRRIERERTEADQLRARSRRRFAALLDAGAADLEHVRARVHALSPQSTLDRGYAVVRRTDGLVVRAPDEAQGTLRVRVARGDFDVVVA